jgi:hypothetical protein
MEPVELLGHLTDVLERLGLAYLITGSTATIAYGEPRFTNDIDVVVELPEDRVAELCAAFPGPEYYVSPPAATLAVRARHQFNILHPGSGLKIDVIVASLSEFDRCRLQRGRRLAVLPDRAVMFASPEDVIVKKMAYYQEGGSEKHLRDIAGVIKIQGDALDRNYIGQWSEKLGLSELWASILAQAQP